MASAPPASTVAPAPRAQAPYVGPSAVPPDMRLYGRERETAKLLNLLLAERIVLFYSPSGAGKTSLIQAALIPRLRERRFKVSPVLRVNREPPRELSANPNFNRYVFSVLSGLEEAAPSSPPLGPAELAGLSLSAYFERRIKPDATPGVEALIFDQFEEVLTLDPTDQAEKLAFFSQLGKLLEERTRWALIAMREDFIAGLDPYLLPVPTRFNNTLRLDLLDQQSARQAIQQPSRAAGVDFTDQAATQLCDDLRQVQVQQSDGSLTTQLGAYVEPVQLQVVCLRLWEHLPPGKTSIEPADLGAIGDVDSSLADYYAERVSQIAAGQHLAERDIRAWVENQLISPQGVRLQVPMEPEHTAGLDNAAIRALEDARLIRGERRRGATWYELSHDRLIKPVRENNAAWFAANLNVVQRQAVLWDSAHRKAGLLLSGESFEEAERWANEPGRELTQVEQEFMQAGRLAHQAEKRDRQRNQSCAVVGFMAVLAAIVAILFGIQAGRSVRQANMSLTQVQAALTTVHQALNTAQAAQNVAQAANTEEVLALSVADQSNRKAETQAAKAHNAQGTADGALIAAQTQGASLETAQVDAENQRVTAQSEAATAQAGQAAAQSAFSRQLAAQAQEFLTKDVDLALLLGVEAYRITDTVAAQQALSSAIARKTPRSVELLPGRPIPRQGDLIFNLAFSPDGRLLAWGTNAGVVDIWDVSAQNFVLQSGFRLQAYAVAFSADSQTLAAAGQAGILYFWTVGGSATALAKDPPKPDPNPNFNSVTSLAYSPDGKHLAVGRAGGTIEIWDAPTQTFQRQLPQQNGFNLWGLAWSAAGDRLASSDAAGKVIIWDTSSPDAARWGVWLTPQGKTQGTVWSVAWSPDGQWLASSGSDGAIWIWNPNTGQVIAGPLVQNSFGLYSLSVAQDGKVLAAGGADDTVVLWDMSVPSAPLPFQVLTGQNDSVRTVAFSPVAPILAAGSVDRTILLRRVVPPVDNNQPLDAVACQLVGRNMTKDEWNKYFPGVDYRATCPGK